MNPRLGRLLALLLLGLGYSPARGEPDYEGPPIRYSASSPTDAVARLKGQIEAGGVTPQRRRRLGWLPAVLKALEIPESSQTLVFSKTSLQRKRISPARPRALYYNDSVYVGYVRHGDKLELSAVDPELGAVFYTVDQTNRDRLVITRDRGQCLSCHATRRTSGVPGYLVRSVFPDATGEPLGSLGGATTSHRTPLADRFGGWYVTGLHGGIRHRGNAVADPGRSPPLDRDAAANRRTLEGLVDTRAYPRPGSDIVALMVLEHQANAHNLITKAAYQARTAVYYEQAMNKAFDRPEGFLGASSRRRIEAAGEALLQCLFFCGEAELASPIVGSSSFTTDFAAAGPRDKRGRSLREFDLETLLFRYPCSFLIYSESIDALPEVMRDFLARRTTEILSGKDRSGDYGHLTPADRRAVYQILRETAPERLR
ncbi:MAG: hypothetical protein AAF790_04810 [Planctomycetota bacterium]